MKETYLKFRQNPNFKDCSEEEIKALFNLGKEVTIQSGEYLVQEGEPPREIFFLIEGELDILKKDTQLQREYSVATLHPDDVVGELGLIDRAPRSASVRALMDATLISIPIIEFRSLAEKSKSFSGIVTRISQKIAERLRTSTETTLSTLKAHVVMSNFFVMIIAFLGIFSFALSSLKYLVANAVESSYITIPYLLILVVIVWWYVKHFHFSLSIFGVTRKNWKRSLYEGILFTIPVLILLVFVKWIYIHFIPEKPLFQNKTFSYLTIIYVLFTIPLQELIARGIIQGSLEQFLLGKHKKIIALGIASLLFSTLHLAISLKFGLIALFPGLYFGWLYSRTSNLIAPSVAHAMIGIWGLDVIGFL